MDVYYHYEHKPANRDSTSSHLSSILYPIIGNYFNTFRNDTFKIYYFSKGENEFWDVVRYKFSCWRYNKPACVEALDRYLGTAATKQVEHREANSFGECSEDGPFCNLPGGRYLDAIYNNDMKTIEEIDRKALPHDLSLLAFTANKFMYAYHLNWLRCCEGPKYIGKTFTYTADTIRYKNLYGMDMGTAGGWTKSADYFVPREFSYLLNRLGNFSGVGIMELQAARWKGVGILLKGIDMLQRKYKCESPEVKQFERNLISLTTRYLKTKE